MAKRGRKTDEERARREELQEQEAARKAKIAKAREEMAPFKRSIQPAVSLRARNGTSAVSWKHECAVCFWTHADVRFGSNYYHEECLNELKREFHHPPDRIVKHERSRIP